MLNASDHRGRANEAMAWALAETDPELKAYWTEAVRRYADCADKAEAREYSGEGYSACVDRPRAHHHDHHHWALH